MCLWLVFPCSPQQWVWVSNSITWLKEGSFVWNRKVLSNKFSILSTKADTKAALATIQVTFCGAFLNIEPTQSISFSEIVCYVTTHGLCHCWTGLGSPKELGEESRSCKEQAKIKNWFYYIWVHVWVHVWQWPKGMSGVRGPGWGLGSSVRVHHREIEDEMK